jgi:FdhD protein
MAARGVGERQVFRIPTDGEPFAEPDPVAVEEPLEIRIAGEPVAVTMRTPGDDAKLAVGFLYAEGILRSVDDLGTVTHCGRPGEEGYGNVLDVVPASGASFDVDRLLGARRGTLTTAACGVCGRKSIDDLLQLCGTVPEGPRISREVLRTATDRLKDAQVLFTRTGGTHAAAALDAEGRVLEIFEDVGRHNAVDKVVGALVYARAVGRAPQGPRPAVLAVSGRASFEVVQKAAMARIPVIASVSAASTLAVDLAERSGITLCNFVRGGRFNVYAHPERLGP